jgi:tRNA threonylcarbamoyladenosine biosynthesis protein TsaB
MKKEEFRTNDFLLCPMIDARRIEVFTSLYNHSGIEIEPVVAKIIEQDTFHHYLDEQRVVFF